MDRHQSKESSKDSQGKNSIEVLEEGQKKEDRVKQQQQQTKPPLLSDEVVKSLCRNLFNIQVERVRELNSYDDRNYNVLSINDDEFVLKITNSGDSGQKNLIESQNEMILFLHQKKFHVPFPMKNINGHYVVRRPLPNFNSIDADDDDDDENNKKQKYYAIRLFHYVPGIILYNVQMNRQLLIDCGQYLAHINLALESFDNETIRQRKFLWSLSNVPNLYQYVGYIEKQQHKELVIKCFQEFETEIMNDLDSLKHSYLHGDFNEQNIIIIEQNYDDDNSCGQSNKETAAKNYRIHGLIDFGDIVYGPQIFDIAIFLAYVMLLPYKNDGLDPILDAPKFVLDGYRALIQLTLNDIRKILICSRARLSQSLTLGAFTYSLQPNNEYLLTTARKGWPILEQLCNYDTELLITKWAQKTMENEQH